MLDYPGRPALATLDNNTRRPQPCLLEHVPPLQTRPYNLVAQAGAAPSTVAGGDSGSVCGGGRQLAAEWDEELCVDLPPEALAAADALLLLEVLQPPSGFQQYQVGRLDRYLCVNAPAAPAKCNARACIQTRPAHVAAN